MLILPMPACSLSSPFDTCLDFALTIEDMPRWRTLKNAVSVVVDVLASLRGLGPAHAPIMTSSPVTKPWEPPAITLLALLSVSWCDLMASHLDPGDDQFRSAFEFEVITIPKLLSESSVSTLVLIAPPPTK